MDASSFIVAEPPRVTFERVLAELCQHHFAVLSTVGEDGSPHAAGVTYGTAYAGRGLVLYVMKRRHLRKARDIDRHPEVALVVPIEHHVLRFLPPATIQLHGRAEILELGRAKLSGQPLAPALRAVAEQSLPVHADDRSEAEIVGEGAILDDVGRLRTGAETAVPDARREVEAGGRPRCEPLVRLHLDDRWEVMRALGSRRSERQLRALPFDGDIGPWLPVLPHELPVHDLDER